MRQITARSTSVSALLLNAAINSSSSRKLKFLPNANKSPPEKYANELKVIHRMLNPF